MGFRQWYGKRAGLSPAEVLGVRPNLVISTCYQAAWEKLFRYMDIEPRLVQLDGGVELQLEREWLTWYGDRPIQRLDAGLHRGHVPRDHDQVLPGADGARNQEFDRRSLEHFVLGEVAEADAR